MTQKTINILNQLNKQFYDETGSVVWNQKPDYYWQGWYQLTAFINDKLTTKQSLSNQFKILDLGCGNSRFANFLVSELDSEQVENIEYLGVDFSVNLIDTFKTKPRTNFANFELLELDVISQLHQLKEIKFDLIVIFGLIHHIPSHQARTKFFEQVSSLLKPSGLLIFTTWQYLDTPRLIKRVVDPETETGKSVFQRLGIQKTDLEPGDNILDWVKKVFSYRYSHYFDEAEVKGFITDNNLNLVHSFVCDGRDSKRNRYYVCGINKSKL
jgi:tRNA (uracil-5-)-methyltransferase TRM9